MLYGQSGGVGVGGGGCRTCDFVEQHEVAMKSSPLNLVSFLSSEFGDAHAHQRWPVLMIIINYPSLNS